MEEPTNNRDDRSRIEQLVDELERTNATLRRAFSFRYTFLRGLLFGIATVIDTSVVATVALSFGREFIQTLFGV